MMLRRSLALAVVALVSGCATEGADDAASSEDAVIDGNETFAHPEIGMLRHLDSYCTATLIRPNVILTAAHCVSGTPKDEAVADYVWDIKTSATTGQRFVIDRAFAVPVAADFADGTERWRAKDIALLKLTTAVPESLAKPLAVATTKPAAGNDVELYGYGCISRTADANGHRPGGGTKRMVDLPWSAAVASGAVATRNTCPGDSGGPWLDVAKGAVFGTTSGYVNFDDRYGDVPASAALVNEVANRWAAQ